MNPFKDKITLLTSELNSLLNKLYEHNKTSQQVTEVLIAKNTVQFIWKKVLTLISLKGLFAFLLVFVPGSVLSFMTGVFHPLWNLPAPTLFFAALIFLTVFFFLIRKIVLYEMTRLDSPFFHIGLYEKLRPAEYQSLVPLARQKDFVNRLREDLFHALKESPDTLEPLLEEKNTAIRRLLVQLESTEEKVLLFKEKYDLLLQFLFQLKRKLNLLVNDRFTLDSINFGTNYSLYKVINQRLIFIDAYGVNKAELDETIDTADTSSPFVQALHYSFKDPLINEHMISWNRTLQDNSEWVLSLHLDESNRTRFLENTDVARLNLAITQELLWICCELVNKFKQKG
ncbi:hypothetical protein JSY36_10070 [Bacillus sp. H-16]|uniref:hypothetical protein n=1 Tax=Alteribacter salitolerans TaxID=2912333 RepID=UPI0019649A6B|nr:hypothetical protein [Alteribacter salitolerans]MBM7096102.1 hypothetical protein [Alteribacter salitolerans]